ncbi:MAG: hypothetical protein AVDCRST_MAG56-437 [uncultured Cytophagales bacterium]|uniref:Uncharacterized protein n=1 Tax=uncultured Cytophagales bacterium TaxID=158755 RepID=A0A6J4HF73_9SPHI|nr:MAG: hypothetical protein AVDCRST_MAG56-437 [uncultured Cytophagales bacterium]
MSVCNYSNNKLTASLHFCENIPVCFQMGRSALSALPAARTFAARTAYNPRLPVY